MYVLCCSSHQLGAREFNRRKEVGKEHTRFFPECLVSSAFGMYSVSQSITPDRHVQTVKPFVTINHMHVQQIKANQLLLYYITCMLSWQLIPTPMWTVLMMETSLAPSPIESVKPCLYFVDQVDDHGILEGSNPAAHHRFWL